MTDWTPCTPLVGEPGYWDTDQAAIRRRLSGVAQGIADLRAVAVHFECNPDQAIAAWEGYAREQGDDGMATFNRFLKRCQPFGRRSFRIPNIAAPPIEDFVPEIEGIMAATGASFATVASAIQDVLESSAVSRTEFDALATFAHSPEIMQLLAPTDDHRPAQDKPDRRCHRCGQRHGSRPCRQAPRGK